MPHAWVPDPESGLELELLWSCWWVRAAQVTATETEMAMTDWTLNQDLDQLYLVSWT